MIDWNSIISFILLMSNHSRFIFSYFCQITGRRVFHQSLDQVPKLTYLGWYTTCCSIENYSQDEKQRKSINLDNENIFTMQISIKKKMFLIYLLMQTRHIVFWRAPKIRLYHFLFWISSPKRFLTMPSLSLALKPSINENSLTSKNSSWNQFRWG